MTSRRRESNRFTKKGLARDNGGRVRASARIRLRCSHPTSIRPYAASRAPSIASSTTARSASRRARPAVVRPCAWRTRSRHASSKASAPRDTRSPVGDRPDPLERAERETASSRINRSGLRRSIPAGGGAGTSLRTRAHASGSGQSGTPPIDSCRKPPRSTFVGPRPRPIHCVERRTRAACNLGHREITLHAPQCDHSSPLRQRSSGAGWLASLGQSVSCGVAHM